MAALWALGLSLCITAEAQAAPGDVHVLICRPGGPRLKSEEQKVLHGFYRYIESKLGLPAQEVGGEYINERKACDAALAKGAAILLLPPQIMIPQEKGGDLALLAQVKANGDAKETFHLMAKTDGPADLAALKGKSLTGTTLGDPTYVATVLLEGKLGAPGSLKLVPNRRGLRALKAVVKGKADAVLLDASQYRAVEGSPFEKKLRRIHETRKVPTPAVGIVPSRLPKDFGAKFKTVLLNMRNDEAGKRILDTIGVDGFIEPDLKAWGEIRKLLGAG